MFQLVCRNSSRFAILLAAVWIAAVGPVWSQWAGFEDQTSTRLTAAFTLGAGDVEEKDFAWGDVDLDGDIDLVIVRKEPFTTPGKRRNVLLMNEGGVLVDRTTSYATASLLAGDQGFLTPTNDRDVQLVDVNNDGWLDIVTAVTISDGDSKEIGHPRIYMNLKNAGPSWQGFRFEPNRTPLMIPLSGIPGFNPRFCSVAAGDVTGDGFVDLWFGDYDSGGTGGFDPPAGSDFNDRLLINNGQGKFVDATQHRFSGVVPAVNEAFDISAFGAAGAIADINQDGVMDIVKQTALQTPTYVGVAYNDAATEGFFDTFQVANAQAPYFFTVGDLNNDIYPDLVVSDDGADRYMINQGVAVPGDPVSWVSSVFAFDQASDDGFGGNNFIADLNNDGWDDVLITDVDVDIEGCTRRMHVYRNLGGNPGDNVVLQEQTSGFGCATASGNPSTCMVVGIPADKLEGVHDVAVFDIDGDGWNDMVVGRCSGTEVYINTPPVGLRFSYPQGLPLFVPPAAPFVFQVAVEELGGAVLEPGSVRMFAAVDGAPFSEVPLVDLGSNVFEATLPATPACADSVDFYFIAEDTDSEAFVDPPGAPAAVFTAVSVLGSVTTFEDHMEGDVSAWTVFNDSSLTGGAWEQAVPIGLAAGNGELACPSTDADAAQDQVRAFLTENATVGDGVADADVDGGPTDLVSPIFDLEDTDGRVTYSRFYYSDGPNQLTVWITGDGSSWTLVEAVPGDQNAWTVASFQAGEYITPTASMQVRFRAEDPGNNSIVEAAVDAFRVEKFLCTSCSTAIDCADTKFCNGTEQCVDEICFPGANPCVGSQCDETQSQCVDCFFDEHCDDGDFCNGAETCSSMTCVSGVDPCAGGRCEEILDVCPDCIVDAECDDGIFCNGPELCAAPGLCAPSAGPVCPGLCDESNDICVGTVDPQPRAGDPLFGLNPTENDRFEKGAASFNTVLDINDGLGPIFNQNSCAACHNNPVGGSGSISVTRFGFNDDKGGGFDDLANLGGSLAQAQSITPECAESIPPEANVTALRVTSSTLGAGLIEAIPDASIEANALNPPSGLSGRVHLVPVLEDPGATRVGRFGWKSQLATVLSFSGDASLNEMGLTNRVVGTENAPNGDMALLATCDNMPDPEDAPDIEGYEFIDRVTNFQRYLAPPPQAPRSGMNGELWFTISGCNGCHVRQFTTADDPLLESALRNRVIAPYSDFLLHDMGSAADFIVQGDADARELRTAPLWGLRFRDPMWHDGRVAGGTFQSRVLAAIALHDALGSEAGYAAQSFLSLSQSTQDDVLAFLDSLGRPEFDQDGDGDVDADDFDDFQACYSGPGFFYTPNDACAVSDVDQDGDVDDDDYALFLVAVDGGYGGRVPDGSTAPGAQLSVEKSGAGQITVSWGLSCQPGDDDYAVYSGVIGSFSLRAPVTCSTGGMTTETFTPIAGDRYYLVVPNNGFREGAYGTDGAGVPRSPDGASACMPQAAGACE